MRLRLLAAAFLTLPLTLTAQTPQLIPVPREYRAQGDRPLPHGVQITCNGCDAEEQFAATDLRNTLAERGVPTDDVGGLSIRLERKVGANLADAARPEGYLITSTN